MFNEPLIIMKRRFVGRILESGLLILAIALGVGAAASGLSLLFNTTKFNNELLSDPQYKEIIAATRSNTDEMESPVIEKVESDITLSKSDLTVGDITPSISYSYIVNNERIRFMDGDFGNFGPAGGEPPSGDSVEASNAPALEEGEQGKEQDNNPFSDVMSSYEEAKNSSEYIFPDLDTIEGREISQDFFNAMSLNILYGSLFTTQDYQNNSSYIIVGKSLAEKLVTDGSSIEDLINKKILSFRESYTIVGILDDSNTDFDSYYYAPIKELSDSRFRMGRGGDQQLRFFVENPSDLYETSLILNDYFNTNYGEGQIILTNPRDEVLKIIERNRGVSLLILFLSVAGLFIAAVNVSNILMSRSIRLQKHIGILKALGATKKSILSLLTSEALFINITGALVGVILAIPLSITMEESLGLKTTSWLFVAIGIVASTILSFIFSIIPVKGITEIEAAEAMRNDG